MPPPIPDLLLGRRKSAARTRISHIAQELVDLEECQSRLEALRLLQEEIACMESEERGALLLLRGWGETLDFGFLEPVRIGPEKMSNWASRLYHMISVTKVRKMETDWTYDNDMDMLVSFTRKQQSNEEEESKDDSVVPKTVVIQLSSLYSNREIMAWDDDSLKSKSDDENNHHNNEEELEGSDNTDEEEVDMDGMNDDFEQLAIAPPIAPPAAAPRRTGMQLFGGEDEEEDDSESDEDNDGILGDEEEDDEEHDDDEEEDDSEEEETTAVRVDYTLKVAQSNVADGASKTVIKLSFLTCHNHAWDPEFFSEEDREEGKKEGGVGSDSTDFYPQFERTGTGEAYGVQTKAEDFHRYQDSMLMWAADARPPRVAVKKKRKSFVLKEKCECLSCGVTHRFRVELNWDVLYALVASLDPAFDTCKIEPNVLYRYEDRITNPEDALFAMVKAVRLLAFLMVYTAGSSGYAISPVDFFFGSVVSEGVPIFAGVRLSEFYADYESDGSQGVD